jgi:hypothetical protein
MKSKKHTLKEQSERNHGLKGQFHVVRNIVVASRLPVDALEAVLVDRAEVRLESRDDFAGCETGLDIARH